MSDWNPDLYSRFEDERTRPAIELLARVRLGTPKRVVDLGCGPGNSTELLARRYPQAHIVGTDTSPSRLAAARERLPSLTFERSDIASWTPAHPVDLAYANASLQWVGDHERLLPRLLSALAPGGVLAVQMPVNLDEPSHRLMRDVALDPRFAARFNATEQPRVAALSVERYYDLLAASADVDVWRTTYFHRIDNAAGLVEWLRATGLRPYLDALAPEMRQPFVAEYERRIDAAYPARSDGRRLLAFPRLFIVAALR